jgi:hypothetical protein
MIFTTWIKTIFFQLKVFQIQLNHNDILVTFLNNNKIQFCLMIIIENLNNFKMDPN